MSENKTKAINKQHFTRIMVLCGLIAAFVLGILADKVLMGTGGSGSAAAQDSSLPRVL